MLESQSKHSSEYSGESLCFDKNEFLKANFSVDEFLHKNRNVSSLELLRDNLGLYLKRLRASMIDLINEDYADFVSLSANLVGLDQSIAGIQTPLDQFRNEILSIHTLIETNIEDIQQKLATKRQLRALKRNLQSLKKVHETISKLENLLTNQLSSSTPRLVDLERAALELVQLKFNQKFCSEYLDERQKTSIEKLETSLHEKLRSLFGETVRTANSTCSEPLERCLRIYITLDATVLAEKVFREDFVAPYMSDIVSEHMLQKTPQGLAGIYSKILNFISLHMTDLLRLTQYTDKVRGFNFVVESFWADVEMRLETHMCSIFAPGNSEVFFAKYKCTRDFLNKIEELLANSDNIIGFRQHKQTKSFHARWNLPVYFQICFQEIAGDFESTLEPVLSADILTAKVDENHFQLRPFSSAIRAINRCWSDGVYLPEVFPKFFKLHIQILLRLSHWIVDVLQIIIQPNWLSVEVKKIAFLVALYVDIQSLLSQLNEHQIPLVLKNLPTQQDQQQQELNLLKETVEKSFNDIKGTITKHLFTIEQVLVDTLINECGTENVRQVNDLPRLYRKTNRDIPTRCSNYVDQILKPLKIFNEDQLSNLGEKVVKSVLQRVLNKLTKDYSDVVNDVLTSVQKTEESLRRLKNLKSGAGGSAIASAVSLSNSITSDDDKIRLQLRVDVLAWTGELSKLGFTPSDIEKLVELNDMVQESIKLK
uniref:Conserved oligomeric Golgi complex subunit 2 n=1 Tax=Glossina morsitans morsitans TaxID=37546 RepID=A0ABK9NDW1_GLOMM